MSGVGLLTSDSRPNLDEGFLWYKPPNSVGGVGHYVALIPS